MSELLPCPNSSCRNKFPRTRGSARPYVECGRCLMRGPSSPTDEGAERAWDALYRAPAPKAEVSDIRALGWAVAVHNDYKLNGISYTFWLFTKGSMCAKGEGLTDAEALDQCRKAIKAIQPAPKAEPRVCPKCGRGVFMHKCTQEHHWLAETYEAEPQEDKP